MEGQKTSESLAGQVSKSRSRGVSGSSESDDCQNKKIRLAVGLLGNRSKRHDVRRSSDCLLFQRILGIVLYATGVGSGRKNVRSVDLRFWVRTRARLAQSSCAVPERHLDSG